MYKSLAKAGLFLFRGVGMGRSGNSCGGGRVYISFARDGEPESA